MAIAVNLIRPLPHYRREAFDAGLKACGFTVRDGIDAAKIQPGDVLLIWNRYGTSELMAAEFDRRGGRVVVAENGYMGADAEGRQYYALARDGHNGSGRWYVGLEPRWPNLGIEIAPWRAGGDYVLVCGQRGIGSAKMASPPNWHDFTAAQFRGHGHKVVVREHPGRSDSHAAPGLDDALAGAYAVAVWSSSIAGKALAKGIPCWYGAPHHVLASAMTRTCDSERNWQGDRLPHFERMAWAQWSVDEIAGGQPFRYLLEALP